MKVAGIIAEWNPFHNGHAYLLQQARKITGADAIVVVMSGNYTQRGEPAITSKWARARAGLENGADLVLELPFWYASQPADIFAYGGVSVLEALGCDAIVFGVETDHFTDYETLAKWMVNHPTEVAQVETELVNDGLSFAEKQIMIINQLKDKFTELAALNVSFDQNSNSLLGYTYAKAIAGMKSDMTIKTVKRIGANHDDQWLANPPYFASGSALRHGFIDQVKTSDLSAYMPEKIFQTINSQRNLPDLAAMYPMIRYLLLVQPLEYLQHIYQIHEGIEHRLVNLARQHKHYTDFISEAKHRSWPEPRIRRALLMIALQVSEMEMRAAIDGQQPMFLLGASAIGRQLLKRFNQKETDKWQLVSRANKSTMEKWPIWFKTDKIYQEYLLQHHQDENFGRPPIFIG